VPPSGPVVPGDGPDEDAEPGEDPELDVDPDPDPEEDIALVPELLPGRPPGEPRALFSPAPLSPHAPFVAATHANRADRTKPRWMALRRRSSKFGIPVLLLAQWCQVPISVFEPSLAICLAQGVHRQLTLSPLVDSPRTRAREARLFGAGWCVR
jgi:hypothetical protein